MPFRNSLEINGDSRLPKSSRYPSRRPPKPHHLQWPRQNPPQHLNWDSERLICTLDAFLCGTGTAWQEKEAECHQLQTLPLPRHLPRHHAPPSCRSKHHPGAASSRATPGAPQWGREDTLAPLPPKPPPPSHAPNLPPRRRLDGPSQNNA